MSLHSGVLIIGRILASEVWGGGLFSRGLIFFGKGGRRKEEGEEGAYYRNCKVAASNSLKQLGQTIHSLIFEGALGYYKKDVCV